MDVAASRKSRQSGIASWPSLLITVLVAGAAAYSFSPRPLPPFPETRIHPNQLLVNGLAGHGGSRLLAAGEQGRILVTTDGGENWHEAKLDKQRGSTFTQILFASDKLALAVGHDSWIVRSEDGGETWKEVNFNADPNASAPLMGVAGPYDGKLFAYGGFGTLLASTDDGKTWTAITDATIGDHHVNAMTRAGDGKLWVAGERGLLASSTDGGQTWQAAPQIYAGSFYGVLSLPGHELVVFGMRGNVFNSKDLGVSWQKSQVPEGLSLFGGGADKNGAVTLVGEAEVILRSTDGGANFKELAQGERKRWAAVLPLAGKHGLLVAGENGIQLKTADGKAVAQPEQQP